MDGSRRLSRERLLLWLAMLAYTLGLGWLSLDRQDRFALTGFDLGIYDQACWMMSRGLSPFLSMRGMHLFADHFTPILYLVSALYHLYDSPKTLLLLQVVALASGALPVFNLAAKRCRSERTALLFALGYLLFPALQWMNLFDFHPDALATPLLLYAFWFIESRRPALFFIAILLALCCKETIGVSVALMAILVHPSIGRRMALLTAVTGLAGVLIGLATMRAYNNGQSSAYFSLYSAYGDTPGAIVANLLGHPLNTLQSLATTENALYFRDLLLPGAFLALFAPRYLLIALPTLLSNLLANRAAMHAIHHQYNAVLIPILFAAAIEGYQRCLTWQSTPVGAPNLRRRRALDLMLAACIAIGVTLSPLLIDSDHVLATRIPRDQARIVDQAVAQIPPDASVCAQTAMTAHLAHRRNIYMFPNPFQEAAWGNSSQALQQELGYEFFPLAPALLDARIRAASIDYVILCDSTEHFPIASRENYHYLVRILLASTAYRVIWRNGDVIVLRRNAAGAAPISSGAAKGAL